MGLFDDGSRANTYALAAVIAAAAALHAAMSAATELTPDEAYYASWAFGWTHGADHPPLVGWLIAGATSLVRSRAEWAVRLPAVVCSAAASSLLAVAGARAGLRAGWLVLLVVVAQLGLLVAAGGFLVTPDAPFIVAWALVVVVLAPQPMKAIHAVPVLLVAGALGGLAKVSMLLALPVVALGSMSCGWRNAALRTVAVSIGLAATAAWWWPSLGFQLGHVGGLHGPSRLAGGTPAELGAALGAFIGLLGPGVFFFGLLGMADRGTRRERLGLIAAALLPLAVVLASAWTAHVEASWTAPAHPPFFVLAVLAMRARWDRRVGRVATVAAVGLSAALFAGAHLIAILGAPWQPDPTVRLRGWRSWASTNAPDRDAPDPRFPRYGLDAERRYYRALGGETR